MLVKFLAIILLLITGLTLQAQNNVWNNKKCAVSLTYDDAVEVDITHAIPALDSVGLKGTFFLSCYFSEFKPHINDWKIAAQHGHELANHTLFHPCIGNRPGREWVKPDYNLATYTVQRMTDEMRMTNIVLSMLDGKTKRTFAYPCGDMKIGDSFYIDKRDFVSARGVKSEMVPITQVDLYNVPAYGINGETGEQLIALVKKAMETNTLLVFLFHGVGGGHSLNVSLEAHSQLLHFLKEHEKEIWVAPFIDITEYVRAYNEKKK